MAELRAMVEFDLWCHGLFDGVSKDMGFTFQGSGQS